MNKTYLVNRMIGFIFFTLSTFTLNAQSTQVTVRALAKDAKFIGTGIGGAYVTIRDHYSQELLAKGYTQGSSGDTDKVIKKPRIRYDRLADDNTAKFVASLSVKEPTLVDIDVVAPFTRRSAAIKSSTQIWVIPGKDILGDGVILEIPGFIVDILKPNTHEIFSDSLNSKQEVLLKTHVVMMCGCTVKAGGLWDSNNYEVVAILRKEGIETARIPLLKTAEDNIFEVKIPVNGSGNYEVIVTAFDTKAYNTGVDKISFVINK